jgi:hypothetical protein
MAMSELGDSQDLSEEGSPTNEGEPDEVAEVLNSEEDEDEGGQEEIEDWFAERVGTGTDEAPKD